MRRWRLSRRWQPTRSRARARARGSTARGLGRPRRSMAHVCRMRGCICLSVDASEERPRPGWLARPRRAHAADGWRDELLLLVVVVVGARREADRQHGHVGRAAAEKVARSPSHGRREVVLRRFGSSRTRFPFLSPPLNRVSMCRRFYLVFHPRDRWRHPRRYALESLWPLLVFQPQVPKSRQSIFLPYLANEARPLAGRSCLRESRRSDCRHSARVPRAFTVGAARPSNRATAAPPSRARVLLGVQRASRPAATIVVPRTEDTRSHARVSTALGGLTRS